jgi:acetyl-CoA decarbonylase/synthase complex subunit delta
LSFEELSKKLAELMKDTEKFELIDVDLIADQLQFEFFPSIVTGAVQAALPGIGRAKGPIEWTEAKLKLGELSYSGTIETIEFVRSNGNKVTLGGQVVPPFYNFLGLEKRNPHPPVVTYDVFDMGADMMLPKPIKVEYEDVLAEPVEWAKFAVKKFGAECITFHSLSIDPGLKDAPVTNSKKTLEELLQAVKVPIIIGCSGNKEKDIELFRVTSEVAAGERSMLSAADKATWEEVVPFAVKYDHNCLLWTSLDMNNQIKINKDAMELGLARDRIVMDPTTATLGYGLEYSFSMYQRMRLAGLLGEENLAFPMSGGTTNAWGAREAWMSEKRVPEWGKRQYRGPLWEIYNALSLAIVGLDLAMMFHPVAAQFVKETLEDFFKEAPKAIPESYMDWVSTVVKR